MVENYKKLFKSLFRTETDLSFFTSILIRYVRAFMADSCPKLARHQTQSSFFESGVSEVNTTSDRN
ncbi:hypothetical protein, partial [Bacillus sp. JJ1764]|uniref:hypothetical protein n=1 Tax=Bacillus sp. JJ1764 TaxID=3122964 RepID=UPI002FFD6DCD